VNLLRQQAQLRKEEAKVSGDPERVGVRPQGTFFKEMLEETIKKAS